LDRISLDEINLLYGNLDESQGLNGGPTLGQQKKSPQLDIFLGMLAAGVPGIGVEKTVRGYNFLLMFGRSSSSLSIITR
jgi:hypothetical protein